MFINFSNHPCSLWGEDQKKEAGKYVPSEAVPFPQVDASMGSDEVQKLANEYAAQILEKKPDCVLCQGEFCVSWHVVDILKKARVRVVAACSERIAKEVYGEQGTEKRSVFRFVQFREY